MTSQLRHHYVVWCKYCWDILQFLVTRLVRMIRAKKYEKWSRFVKRTAKILLIPFL